MKILAFLLLFLIVFGLGLYIGAATQYYNLPAATLLRPGAGGLLSPGAGTKNVASTTASTYASSTPTLHGTLVVDDVATSSLYISSQASDKGGCIELELTGGATAHLYATTTGVALVLYPGHCRQIP